MVPQLFIEVSGVINLRANLSPTLVNEDARAAGHQIGKIHRTSVGIINSSLIRRMGRKIIRSELNPIVIPEKLGGVMAFYLVKVAVRGIKLG